jgi:hypothetical protein
MNTHAVAVNRVAWVAACAALAMSVGAVAQPSDAALDAVVRKMADYVAAYGERASVIVAAEKYTQQLELQGQRGRPRSLVAEFAIVKVAGRVGWTGFRDVVQVDGKSVADRKDRLVALLTGPAGNEGELRRLSNESARYNVGVVIRNFNVPTTTMFFFHPDDVGRFSFRRAGTKTIDGVVTWALDFKETRTPTLVMKRDGTDVPCEGTVWVVPDDGTVVRTRLRLRKFADTMTMSVQKAPPVSQTPITEYVTPAPQQVAPAPAPAQQAPPPSTSGQPAAGGSVTTTQWSPELAAPGRRLDVMGDMFPTIGTVASYADIDVTYRRDAAMGLWLPAKMSEIYEGPVSRGTRGPAAGRTVGLAQYSDFRRFETSVRVVVPQ